MYRILKNLLVVLLIFYSMVTQSSADTISTHWGGNAEMVYDTGFMHMLRRTGDGGVGLFDIELVQNDAPGAGLSEKGVTTDTVWGDKRARKILMLDDPRAEKAYFVYYFTRKGSHPLVFSVNGKQSQVDVWDRTTCHLSYRWTEFPVEWLKKGRNVIEFACPGAATEKEGWTFYLARADEFEHGGGDPADVGKTSFVSTDGGESWKESPFGPLGQTRAEYSVRISLNRYVSRGWLATPVIDIWRGDDDGFIVPIRVFKKIQVSIQADVPDGSGVEYFMRTGISPDPFATGWGPYIPLGEGGNIDAEYTDRDVNGRYIQIRADLSTTNPLVTPIVRNISVDTELQEGMPRHNSLHVVRTENPVIKYPSVPWKWEPADRKEFAELKERENLDGVVAGAQTQFGLITRLLEYATTRVTRKYGTPLPDYPGWDALSIADRIDKHGSVGMCIQFNNFLNGLCMAYGMQARLINVMNHEIAEVWSDDYGKWVYLEASYANHYLVDEESGTPMSMLELHNTHLDYYYGDRAIDWMNELTSSSYAEKVLKEREDKPPVLRSSTTYHQNESLAYKGFLHAQFMRVLPRNNFYEEFWPMPLNHGSGWWPWDGYVNWYDERTPPHRTHSWHTDRPRDIWPDLNLVHIDAATGHSNKFLYLRFETYAPNFSHYEVNVNDSGWEKVSGDRWTWVLESGRNILRVRTVNDAGVHGKASYAEVSKANVPLTDLY